MTVATMGLAPQRVRILSLMIVMATIALLYSGTWLAMVETWSRSEAYRHGFLVPLISGYLVWQLRGSVSQYRWQPSAIGSALIAALAAIWLLGHIAAAQVIEQFAVVAMIPASVLAIAGPGVFRRLRFPLLYLLFAVPFGEFLIPYLIDITATLVVDTLGVLRIPVLRDGRFFQIPTGYYEVARACSGLNYFLATFALATLMAHLFFVKVRKQLAFVGFALLLSITGNSVRATIIVLVLHYSNLDIAAGEDHEFVGWIVYGVMAVILVMTALHFQDKQVAPPKAAEGRRDGSPGAGLAALPAPAAAIVVVIIISIAPLTAATGALAIQETEPGPATIPARFADWVQIQPDNTDWQPRFGGYIDQTLARYAAPGGEPVDVAIVRYNSLRQGAEIAATANAVVDPEYWLLENAWSAAIDVGGYTELKFEEVKVTRTGEKRLVWWWVEIDGRPVHGLVATKVAEIRAALAGDPGVATAFVISSAITDTRADAEQRLQSFIESYYEPLHDCLGRATIDTECTKGLVMSRES